MKNKLRRNSLWVALAATVLTALLQYGGLFNNLENQTLDYRFRLRGLQQVESPIVIAQVDDESLEIIGKWPWPRRIHARLVDICRRAGAKAVVFDVLFLEADRYDPGNDRSFAQAIKKSGKVILGFNFSPREDQVVEQDEKGKALTKTVTFILQEDPLPQLAKAAAAAGFVNTWNDSDGYLRRANLDYVHEGSTFNALGVETVAFAEQKSADELFKNVPFFDSLAWGSPSREVYINWKGDESVFENYNCAKILDPNIPDEWKANWLQDKIILVASTALGAYDHYPTPFSPSLPGVYYHANVIDNLMTGGFLRPVPVWVIYALMLLFGLGCGLLVPQTAAWLGAVVSALAGALYLGAAYLLLSKRVVYIEVVGPLAALINSYLAVFFYRFIVEQKEKAGIKKAFGVYVNPHVVDQIAKNPDALKLGGEVREMTVMFSDVAGFTSISEKLTPPELVHLLNIYLTAMTDTIMKYDGTVDKYEGDAIMAFWGAPLPQLEHAAMACRVILENRKRLEELNKELAQKGMNSLHARCGLNTGTMTVGNMGSSQKFNYTVMGDAVNLASRLEGANKQYGTGLMISETTYEKAKDVVEVRELDLLRVKGKKIPIKVYELVSLKGELTDAQKRGFEVYNEALALYRKQDFKQALKKFQSVHGIIPDDPPSATYIERAEDFIKTPPPKDWDGVYVMTTK